MEELNQEVRAPLKGEMVHLCLVTPTSSVLTLSHVLRGSMLYLCGETRFLFVFWLPSRCISRSSTACFAANVEPKPAFEVSDLPSSWCLCMRLWLPLEAWLFQEMGHASFKLEPFPCHKVCVVLHKRDRYRIIYALYLVACNAQIMWGILWW